MDDKITEVFVGEDFLESLRVELMAACWRREVARFEFDPLSVVRVRECCGKGSSCVELKGGTYRVICKSCKQRTRRFHWLDSAVNTWNRYVEDYIGGGGPRDGRRYAVIDVGTLVGVECPLRGGISDHDQTQGYIKGVVK